jgi:hypothetical protein
MIASILRRLRKDQRGFTMIIAIGVMFVTSLLLVAAFTAANGDVHTSRLTVDQKKAYYAALAGVQEYEYQLQYNPNYWQSCPEPKGEVAGEPAKSSKEESEGTYAVTTLASSSESSGKCNASTPFTSIIESKGTLANTFRIKSVGTYNKETRSVVANFQVAGFLNFVYFTQYEDQDPASYGGNTECAAYRSERSEKHILTECGTIYFGEEDDVKGPMHTNDTAVVCNGVEFGRVGQEPPDAVEINRGTEAGGCGSGSVVYNTATGKPSKGPDLEAPPSDSSLQFYVEHSPQNNEFEGRTKLKLEGSVNKIKVTHPSGSEETIEWPKNGLIYVANEETGCGYNNFEQESTDTTTTYNSEKNCGSVYVEGTYSKSLTIAASTDLIITGSITPTGVTAGKAPTGTPALGLIATRFVRTYHPCSGNPAGFTTPTNPWIYAAILSTSHSFLVDNDQCGSSLGNLNVYGAIGQKFRGIVGTFGGRGGNTGYIKNYLYDERLATDEPPYFLAPLKAGWRIIRETAPTAG